MKIGLKDVWIKKPTIGLELPIGDAKGPDECKDNDPTGGPSRPRI